MKPGVKRSETPGQH